MITARGQANGRPALILGIDDQNVARLTAGQPILVPREAMEGTGFADMEVIIVHGKTQADVMANLVANKSKADS